MTRQTILFVVPRFHTNLFFAAKALTEAGHGVAIFAAGQDGIEDYSVVAPQVFGRAPDRGAVAAAIDAVAPNLVLLRYAWGVSDHVRALCAARGVPIWIYNQTPLTRRLTPRQRLGLLLRRRRPERRVTPVPGNDPHARADGHVRYLPWPVDTLPTGPVADDPDGRLRLLCVGKFGQRRKNHHRLLDAVEAAGLTDRVRVTLVGSSSLSVNGADPDYLPALRAREAAADWIEIHTDQPFAAMASFYAAADICVLPSVGEALGTAPIEAMAYGTVPVVSEGAGSAGYITDGVDGLWVDMSRPETLAGALSRLAADPALRAALSDGALATARGPLSPGRFVARVNALIAEG